MLSFIRRHWVAYLIVAAVAIVLGFGVAYFVGVKGSTPEKVRTERIAAEKRDEETLDKLQSGEEDPNVASDSADTSGQAEQQ